VLSPPARSTTPSPLQPASTILKMRTILIYKIGRRPMDLDSIGSAVPRAALSVFAAPRLQHPPLSLRVPVRA